MVPNRAKRHTCFLTSRIEIAVGQRTFSDKKCYISGTAVSKQYILSCTLSLSIICGKSLKLKLVQHIQHIIKAYNKMTLHIYTASNLTRTHSLQTATIIYFYLKELQIITINYFCLRHTDRRKHDQKIRNCYLSKLIYSLAHQTKYLHMEKQAFFP